MCLFVWWEVRYVCVFESKVNFWCANPLISALMLVSFNKMNSKAVNFKIELKKYSFPLSSHLNLFLWKKNLYTHSLRIHLKQLSLYMCQDINNFLGAIVPTFSVTVQTGRMFVFFLSSVGKCLCHCCHVFRLPGCSKFLYQRISV